MRLYIIRHGTTPWNTQRRIQGCTDIPLDEQGEKIARLSGQSLAEQGIRFLYVYSSPLMRAMRTAKLVSPESIIQTDPRLRELGFGPLEGRYVADMKLDETCPFRYFQPQPEKYNEAVLLLEKAEPEKEYESLSSLRNRAADFMQTVIEPLAAELPEDACVLISGHGALNRALIMYLRENYDFQTFWGDGLQANCGICIVDVLLSSDGTVNYTVQDENRIFYDPDAVHIPELL